LGEVDAGDILSGEGNADIHDRSRRDALEDALTLWRLERRLPPAVYAGIAASLPKKSGA
jgi:hypothetical protein